MAISDWSITLIEGCGVAPGGTNYIKGGYWLQGRVCIQKGVALTGGGLDTKGVWIETGPDCS